jgi:hypothetical protein
VNIRFPSVHRRPDKIIINPFDPELNGNTQKIAGAILFELLNLSIQGDFADNDVKAELGNISRIDYVLAQERLEFENVLRHHELAFWETVPGLEQIIDKQDRWIDERFHQPPWGMGTDIFANRFKHGIDPTAQRYGDLTFDQAMRDVSKAHLQNYGRFWDKYNADNEKWKKTKDIPSDEYSKGLQPETIKRIQKILQSE